MSNKVYPPHEIADANEKLDSRILAIQQEVAEKHGLKKTTVYAIVEEVTSRAAEVVFEPVKIGTYYTGSGFPAVDPAHFRKMEYTRLFLFIEALLTERSATMAEHELGLMLQEIKDLRNVLKIQFKYDWTQHRAAFPLIAQWGI